MKLHHHALLLSIFPAWVKLLIFRDHAGGNDKMKELVPGIKVFGGSIDNVKGCTDKLDNGDKLSLGAEVNILSLHTPWWVKSWFIEHTHWDKSNYIYTITYVLIH